VPRYNVYNAAELDGSAAPGYSQGQAIQLMEKLAAETLPPGFAYEWTGIAYQQIKAGNTAIFAFALGVLFVFLVLAAQFESLTLPLSVIMIVPMCLVAAILGVVIRGMDNNILTQVGFIVSIGLAAKNAILIVEFAKQLEDQGEERHHAAEHAAQLRLRPILMTSLAFVLGVTPLVWATGAGAELRQALGTAVFSGMIGVTVFGLIFTPAYYIIARWLADLGQRRRKKNAASDESAAAL
jgi:multidrug efflux pump subunit AcrB